MKKREKKTGRAILVEKVKVAPEFGRQGRLKPSERVRKKTATNDTGVPGRRKNEGNWFATKAGENEKKDAENQPLFR